MPNRFPDNATPDDATPDNATPDNATPDDRDGSDSRKPTSQKNTGSSSSNNTALIGDGSDSRKPTSQKNTGSSSSNNTALIGALIGVGIVLIVLIIICIICFRRRKKRRQMFLYQAQGKAASGYYSSGQQSERGGKGEHVKNVQSSGITSCWGGPAPSSDSSMVPPLPPPSPNVVLGLKGGTFSYEELEAATNRFNEANLLGQGGFGYVHKGVLPNGKEVAVKSLKANSGQGEREFQAEIDIISRVHHRHLVSLVGYCITSGQRMLVYEFVPNKTLEYHLYAKDRPPMDWTKRMRIAIGSAKGLAYLHEDCHPRIIHRDIKAANVLIDDSFEAKVADFGLAKLTNDANTHVSTRVMGTFGYLAPEYAASGKLTEKSDVFSFGVMLLEIMTGKRPVDITNAMEDSLVDWARPILGRGLDGGNFSELADPLLEGNYNNEEMARMAACVAASIRHSARKRPKMSQIVRALEGDVQLDDLSSGANADSKYGNSGYDTTQYQIDMNKIRQLALSSQEFNSDSTDASH